MEKQIMCERPKIALLGGGGVGKTAILHRFLFDKFQDTYVETVEEIYSYQFSENGKRLYVNFLDTAGNISFPAMRQLYISKAQAFVLVYSIKDEQSFYEIKSLWEQIKQVRSNILDIPCVIVGNNLDEEKFRQVETFEALNWACSENLGGCFIETSAKENRGIQDMFSLLLEQFLTRRHEHNNPFKLRSVSLHQLQFQRDVKCKDKSNDSKALQKAISSEKLGSHFGETKYLCSDEGVIKDERKKDKCVGRSGSIRRSRTDGVIEISKSQARRKLHLF